MTELCLRIYRYFRSHRAAYWLSLAGLFLFCGYFAAQIHLEEDLNKLMPSSRNEDGTTKLASLQRIGLVKSYTHTDQLFIPLRVQQERIDAWKRYWTDERLEQVRRLIAATTPAAGLRPEAFTPFFDYATADYEPDALYEAGFIPAGYQSTLMEQSYNGEYLCFTSVHCANDMVRSHTSDYYRICDAIANEPGLMVLSYVVQPAVYGWINRKGGEA